MKKLLWIMGWVFLFPLPLTILLIKKKKLNVPVRYGIITVAWILYLVIAIGGSSSNNNQKNSEFSNVISRNHAGSDNTADATMSRDTELILKETNESSLMHQVSEEASRQAAEEPSRAEASRQAAEEASRAEASRQAAEEASRKAEEAAKAREIKITSELVFRRNEYATVTIKSQPNTQYTITIIYNSGPSKADGLHPKISDANGNVSWTWKIGGSTTPGKYTITISGGGETIKRTFEVITD